MNTSGTGFKKLFFFLILLVAVPLLAIGIIDKFRRSSEGWEIRGKQGITHFVTIEPRLAGDRAMLEQIGREILKAKSQGVGGVVMFFDSEANTPKDLPMTAPQQAALRAAYSSNSVAGESFTWSKN